MAKPGETPTVDPVENRDATEAAEAADPSKEAPAAEAPKPEKTPEQKEVDRKLAEAERKKNEAAANKIVDDADEENDEENGTDPEEPGEKEEESGFLTSVVDYFNQYYKENPEASMSSALLATAWFAAKEWFSGEKKEEDAEEEDGEKKEENASQTKEAASEEGTQKSYEENIKELLGKLGLSEGKDAKDSFFRVTEGLAKDIQEKYGIPYQVTLAQACLESGHGESGLTQRGLNCFGIKAGSSYSGRRISMNTTEHRNGRDQTENANFRAYDSLEGSFEDYAKLLTNSDRYKPAFEHKDDPKRFLEEVIRAGYATDPKYVTKAEKVLQSHDLTLDVQGANS